METIGKHTDPQTWRDYCWMLLAWGLVYINLMATTSHSREAPCCVAFSCGCRDKKVALDHTKTTLGNCQLVLVYTGENWSQTTLIRIGNCTRVVSCWSWKNKGGITYTKWLNEAMAWTVRGALLTPLTVHPNAALHVELVLGEKKLLYGESQTKKMKGVRQVVFTFPIRSASYVPVCKVT